MRTDELATPAHARVGDGRAVAPHRGAWRQPVVWVALAIFIASLVGCIIPRTWEHWKAMRTPPGRAPKNLGRLPMNDAGDVDKPLDEVKADVSARLKRWHLTETPADEDRAGAVSFSAERGYFREFGNLVFHLGLVALAAPA